jgi:hypothetical protein
MPVPAKNLPHSLPYGLRRLILTPYVDTAGSVLATASYKLPIAQTLSFSETEEFDELRGDDRLSAIHGRGSEVDGSLASGGISIPVWAIISGGKVTETGIAPNRKRTLNKQGGWGRPYFRVDGQMVSDSGGNVNARIYRCKCNGKIEAQFSYGQFQISTVGFKGTPLPCDYGSTNDWLYEIIQGESKSELSLTPELNPDVMRPPQGTPHFFIDGGKLTQATNITIDSGSPNMLATKEVDGGWP